MATIAAQFPHVIDAMECLVEENFRSDVFSSAALIDQETTKRLEAVTNPRIVLQANTESDGVVEGKVDPSKPDPFV